MAGRKRRSRSSIVGRTGQRLPHRRGKPHVHGRYGPGIGPANDAQQAPRKRLRDRRLPRPHPRPLRSCRERGGPEKAFRP